MQAFDVVVSLFRTAGRLGAARSRLPSYTTDGLAADVLSTAEAGDIGLPIGRGSIAGGIRYLREARCDPDLYLKEMVRAAARAGVAIHAMTNVRRLQARSGRITAVETSESSYRAGTVVVAAGAWSSSLTEAIGLTPPIAPARGDWWDFGLTPEWAGSSPLFLEEDRVAITPLQDRVRVTSGFRLGSLRRYDPRRRQRAPRLPRTSSLSRLVRTPPLAAATGLRPCTPDGLPIVGRTARANNLIVASGHGTLGLTLAPVTSVLVAAILRDGADKELQPLSPDRWSDAPAVSDSVWSKSPTTGSLGG